MSVGMLGVDFAAVVADGFVRYLISPASSAVNGAGCEGSIGFTSIHFCVIFGPTRKSDTNPRHTFSNTKYGSTSDNLDGLR